MSSCPSQSPFATPPFARASIRGLAIVGLSLLALTQIAGCVFLPQSTTVAPPPAAVVLQPDPHAPRLAPLETRHLQLTTADHEVIGEVQVLFTRYENTFSAIAQQYDLGYEELRHANPGVDHWLPGEATPVYLPTEMILPDAPRQGIVINVPSMRLLYFTTPKDAADSAAPAQTLVTSHPIGIGQEGWATPLGETTVTQKARDPVWYVPASVRKEHAERGDPLPSVVQPGPDNPLGRFAMALSMPGYLIHGTNKPAGVGMRSSHGCIRLYPDDIEALFERVTKGTPVLIVNQPVLAGWRDGQLYLEVHRPLTEDPLDMTAEVERVLARAIGRAGGAPVELDREVIQKVASERRGIPFPVLRSQRSPEQYLAAARIVENLTPVTMAEQTARTSAETAHEEQP
jgi:L,D-transpeptidase ErfK/SrfK